MSELSTRYEPKLIEDKWYAFWEQGKYFAPDESQPESFCIVIPPPNVTGILHMGHALVQTVQDLLVRYHRMQGQATLWVPGTDHAGIATQNVVEKALAKEKVTRHQLGREKFVEKVWEWKEKHGDIITSQMRKLGNSCDWESERFTMDEGCSQAVKEVFVRLFEEGLIYRGKYIVNWCPRCHTALSDVEVEYQEETGHLWHLKYPVGQNINSAEFVVVATTRPETMLGDMAVAVNPSDERYQNLVGREVFLPIVNRSIKIMADQFVDKAFGSGAVKVTPAHDPNDFQMAERHGLPKHQMLDENARVTNLVAELNIPAEFHGLKREEARKKVVEEFEKLGLLVKIEDHVHSVGHCYRCNTIIEPYLSPQWFVKMQPLAVPAIAAVREKKIEIIPDRWEKVYLDWMENLRDWCISRQIWWGHRIPVWYILNSADEKITEHTPFVVAHSEAQAHEKVKAMRTQVFVLKQDPDVLDTWFSSALWPFSTLGWPEQTAKLKKHYPTSVLVTGYDILTFWVSRMIVMGMHFMKDVPFRKVYLHGLVRTEDGKKMSKSSGTAVDPLKMIEQYGTDALRFTLTSLLTSGSQDVKLGEDKIKASRNFMNKIWNVARFVLQFSATSANDQTTLSDQWILSRFAHTHELVTQKMNEFDFGAAAKAIYDFTWSEYCDWYIEMFKMGGNRKVLLQVLEGILTLMHPIAPFISEELWEQLGHKDRLIVGKWKIFSESDLQSWENAAIEKDFQWIIDTVTAMRNLRATYQVDHKKALSAYVVTQNEKLKSLLEQNKNFILKLANSNQLEIVAQLPSGLADAAMNVVRDVEVHVPLADLIDKAVEAKRLGLELERIQTELTKIITKLQNEGFVAKAPAAVVAGEKARQKELEDQKKLVETQISKLA